MPGLHKVGTGKGIVHPLRLPVHHSPGTLQVVFTWIIAAPGDKLSSVWYIIAMSIFSLMSTLAIGIPAEWTARPAAALPPAKLSSGAER